MAEGRLVSYKCYKIFLAEGNVEQDNKIHAHSPFQAVGHYVSNIIKEPWRKDEFYAEEINDNDCKICDRKFCKLRRTLNTKRVYKNFYWWLKY